MNIKNIILKEEAERVNKINADNMIMYEKTIKSHQDDIRRSRDEIKKTQKEIDNLDESKRNYIKNLRTIMENEYNHEENIICKKLKSEKLSEYKTEMAKLNEHINNEIDKIDGYKNEIAIQRALIYDKEKKIKEIENYKENIYNEIIEKGRKRILNLCIDYLKENQNTEEHIQYLQNLMNQ